MQRLYPFLCELGISKVNDAEVDICVNIGENVNKILVVVDSRRVVVVNIRVAAMLAYIYLVGNPFLHLKMSKVVEKIGHSRISIITH